MILVNDRNIVREISKILHEGDDLESMLQIVLEKMLEVTGFLAGWVFLLDGKKHSLVAYHQIPEGLSYQNNSPLCKGSCWCIEKCMNGRLHNAVNMIECQRLERVEENNWGSTCDITHHATIPIRAGSEVYGLINVASPKKNHFTSRELEILETIALQVGATVSRIRHFEREQEQRTELALYEERNRLARDLHDSVNQLLFSITLLSKGLQARTQDESLKEPLEDIQNLSNEALKEMGKLIWQLRPEGLEQGLMAAIKKYGELIQVDVEIELQGILDLPKRVEECLWRIAQEALNNVKKHSGSDHVKILFSVQDRVTMVIQDFGQGFNPKNTSNTSSFGLKTMRERIEQAGGSLILESSVGNGTTITVKI